MHPDFKELLSVLNERRVKYLVVGAYAVSIHVQPRATKDLDVLIKADPANARKVFAALAQFGAPLDRLTAADFAARGPFLRMGGEPVRVDILTEIPGVDFDAAWRRRTRDVVDPARIEGELHFSRRPHRGETGGRATAGHRGCSGHSQSGGKPSLAPRKKRPPETGRS
jgi:hypothetical protein